jgi:hypothetical protein
MRRECPTKQVAEKGCSAATIKCPGLKPDDLCATYRGLKARCYSEKAPRYEFFRSL